MIARFVKAMEGFTKAEIAYDIEGSEVEPLHHVDYGCFRGRSTDAESLD